MEASKLLGISPFDGDNLSKLAMTRRFQDLTIGTKQAYDTALANGDQAGMTAARQQAQIYRDAAQRQVLTYLVSVLTAHWRRHRQQGMYSMPSSMVIS